MTTTTPFVHASPAVVKSRIPAVKSAIKSALKSGCSTGHALDISAAALGFRDYNTLKGLMDQGCFYEMQLKSTLLRSSENFRAPLGFFQSEEEAVEAFDKQAIDKNLLILLKDGEPLYSVANSSEFIISDLGSNFSVNGIEVDSDSFDKAEWNICVLSEQIESLVDMMSSQSSSDQDAILDDIEMLRGWDDYFILTSMEGNNYLSPSRDTEDFDDTIRDILLAADLQIQCEYNSEWSHGDSVCTNAILSLSNLKIVDIEQSTELPNNMGSCDKEFIDFSYGGAYYVLECDGGILLPESEDKLKQIIADKMDFGFLLDN